MHKYRAGIVIASLALVFGAERTRADDSAAAPKPILPSVADLLDASGITATGYVSGTFSYQSYSASGGGAPKDYSSFTLQQAAFTLAKQPTSGFGALVNVIAGQNIYTANYSYAGASKTSTQFQLAQAYLQYVEGPVTVIGGKFATLAGAEVLGSVTNTNITRSLLYSYEPVTHTGVRMTYAANEQLNLIVGVNNGWFYSDELSAGTGKTLEAGTAWTPSKAFSWSVQGYYGDDTNFALVKAKHALLDTVATWNATAALTLVGSVDWGRVSNAFGAGTGSAHWSGFAGYANYAFNDQWRVSVRGEYFNDSAGYLTAVGPGVSQKLKEGTVDFGYAPNKKFELRLEGRFDDYSFRSVKDKQAWVEGLFKL